MITVVHLDGLSGINYHRLIVPLLRLKETHGVQLMFIEQLTQLKEIDLDKVDNLLVSRKLSVTNHKEFRKMLDDHGVRLILDNDDYWKLNHDNPAWQLYEVYFGPDIKKTIKISVAAFQGWILVNFIQIRTCIHYSRKIVFRYFLFFF